MISDFTWAVRFPRDRVQEARRLWRVADVQVLDDGGETVWLAGCERNEQVDAILRGFLSGKRFNVLVLERDIFAGPADVEILIASPQCAGVGGAEEEPPIGATEEGEPGSGASDGNPEANGPASEGVERDANWGSCVRAKLRPQDVWRDVA